MPGRKALISQLNTVNTTTQTWFVDITSFTEQVNESLSDNIQKCIEFQNNSNNLVIDVGRRKKKRGKKKKKKRRMKRKKRKRKTKKKRQQHKKKKIKSYQR
jgi:hypothetical protein